MAAPADPGVAGAGGQDSAAGPLLAGFIVLTVLAVLLGVRYHSDADRLALLRGAARAEIFHAFLARTAGGRLVTAAPSTHCRASAFAAFVGPRARRQEATWRSALATAGGGVLACSYAYCPTCPTQGGGPTLIRRAAYEPALALARIATARLVVVEDGRWQRSLFFPEPDSLRAAERDLRTAFAEFAKPQARAGPPQGRGGGS